jgi:hypothetical protein
MAGIAWIDKRREYQQRLDTLAQKNVENVISNLNIAIEKYISRGGLNQDSQNDPNYKAIQESSAFIEDIKQKYLDLYNDITTYLKTQSTSLNLSGLLQKNGELQLTIKQLQKVQDEMKVDMESAIARDELLRSKDTKMNSHDLFLLGRPVRKGMIPYLWALGVLFIGVAIYLLYMSAKVMGFTNTSEGQASFFMIIVAYLYDIFSNKMVLLSLLIAALIVILFLSLKVAGVFGK